MGLFREENHKILVDPEVKLIPEFKKVQARDTDKAKRNAHKEFAYIYFFADYKSPYQIYDPQQRQKFAAKDAGLDPNWEPDKAIREAISKYLELQKTPAIKSLEVLRNALHTTLKTVDAMIVYLNEQLDKIKVNDDPEDIMDTGEAPDVTGLVKTLNELLKLSSQIPDTISTLERVEEQVKKEQTESKRIKGGGSVSRYEQ